MGTFSDIWDRGELGLAGRYRCRRRYRRGRTIKIRRERIENLVVSKVGRALGNEVIKLGVIDCRYYYL